MSGSLGSGAQLGRPTLIVDSWPVLEFLYRHEPARSRIVAIFEAAEHGEASLVVSRITYGEIVYNFIGKRRRGEIPSSWQLDIADLPWTVASVDDALVDEAAELKSRYPISYADCFVAALAIRHNAPVITGDPDFLNLQERGLLAVHWLGA